jgi:lipoprotein-releasing system permease protein
MSASPPIPPSPAGPSRFGAGLPVEWQIGWRYLRGARHGGLVPGRSGFVSFIAALSVAGITLGVAALIVVLSVMNGFRTEVRDRMLDVIAHVEVLGIGPEAPDLEQFAQQARQDPGVRAVAPFAALQGLLGRGEQMRGVWIQGIEPAAEVHVSGLAERLMSGPDPRLAQLQPGSRQVLLGSELARGLRVQPGDPVALVLAPQPAAGNASAPALPRTLGLRHAGSFEVGHHQYDSSWALMHREDVVQIGAGRAAVGLRLRLHDPTQAPEVAARLSALWPERALVRDWTRSNRHWFEAVAQQKRMLGLILTLIVAVAAFNLVSTLVMTVTDKRADIAILRTLGASPASVMAIFMVQGALAGIIGTLGGVALGLLLAWNLDVIVPAIESLVGQPLLPGSVYLISQMPSQPLLSDILPIALVSLLLAFVSTLYPSWRASRVDPAEALRTA